MAQQNAGGRLAEALSRVSSMLALGITQQAGRGLVARRAIPQGTVVLQESPLVCAPAPQHRGKVLAMLAVRSACVHVSLYTQTVQLLNNLQQTGVLRLPAGV